MRRLTLLLLCTVTPAARSSIVGRDASIQRFISWCRENGVSGMDNVAVRAVDGGGLGLFARSEIDAGSVLLRVPTTVCVADRLLIGRDGTTGAQPFAPWRATLAYRMLMAAGDDAAWQPWLDVLPDDVQGLPLSVATDAQYGPGTDTLKSLHAERAELISIIREKMLKEAGSNSVAAAADDASIERALTLADTRAFLLELAPDDPWASCHAFVPLLDMVNHDDDASIEWSLENTADAFSTAIAVTATKRVEAGEELSLNYSPQACNDDFALYYGFVPRSNAFDDVDLFPGVPEAIAWHREAFGQEPSAELEAIALQLASMPPMEGMVHMRRVGVASAGAMGAPLWLRISEADPRLISTFRLLAGEMDPPPEDAGKHAAAAVAARAEEMLRGFATTLDEDLAALGARTVEDVNSAIALSTGEQVDATTTTDVPAASSSSAAEEENIMGARGVVLRYRAGKKAVLRAALSWLRARWELEL